MTSHMLDFERLNALTGAISLVKRLIVSPELVSTQDEARRLAEAGSGAGTLVIADRQTGGRGSRGRHWHSPADTGLYCSLILGPDGGPPSLACWTLAASLAICRACRNGALPAEIKWPNDILIRGRKAAGILAEMRGGGGRKALILGFGVNVTQERSDFPPELADRSTSLRMEGGTVLCREDLAGSILRHLSAITELMYHDGWPQVREDWIGMAPEIHGTAVRIRDEAAGTRSLQGITEGVDELGALIVRLDDGSKMILHSSESLERLER